MEELEEELHTIETLEVGYVLQMAGQVHVHSMQMCATCRLPQLPHICSSSTKIRLFSDEMRSQPT